MEIDDDENPSPEANAAGDVACAGDGGDARQHGAAPAEDDDGDEEARSIDDAEGDPGPDPLLLIHEQQLQNIKEPHSNDVLCGRGVTTNRFPGNCCFRALVGVNKVRIDLKWMRCVYTCVRPFNSSVVLVVLRLFSSIKIFPHP
jgi:hypothetical protein